MKKVIRPKSHIHPLSLRRATRHELEGRCGVCRSFIMRGDDYYACSKGCKYYLHNICAESKLGPEIHHPLHISHPLTFHNQNHFLCNFCEKPGSGFHYHCHKCNFYLHLPCSLNFHKTTSILNKHYKLQHFLHKHHPLVPCLHIPEEKIKSYYLCALCNLDITNTPAFECSSSPSCKFYLHVQCFKRPKDHQFQHPFHPQHSLNLLNKTPYGGASTHKFRCNACRKVFDINNNAFVLHCYECAFNLCIACSFQKPILKQELHDHPLAHFDEIGSDHTIFCAACNTLCSNDLFRCFPCNFNLHFECLPLSRLVYHEDIHVHPLILTHSYREDDSGHYYCNVCEEKRDPDCVVYCCKECQFVAHTHCAVPYKPENQTQIEPSYPVKLGDNLDTSINKEEGDQTETVTFNVTEESYAHVYEQFSTYDQMWEEILQIRETIQELKETLGKEMPALVQGLSQKLEQLAQWMPN